MTRPYEQFLNAGIAVQWANPNFYVTHEKSIVVDEKAALVATFNLMEKYFTLTRKTNPLIVVGPAGVIGYFGVV